MTLKEQIEFDIMSFFTQIESQNSVDKKETLRLLLAKYVHLTSAEFLMSKADLDSIITLAKMQMASKTFPVFIGPLKKRVQEQEQANLCVIESTISFLNKNSILKQLPKFDYREDKF